MKQFGLAPMNIAAKAREKCKMMKVAAKHENYEGRALVSILSSSKKYATRVLLVFFVSMACSALAQSVGLPFVESGAPTNVAWTCIACSADGNTLVAGGDVGIYRSTNSGLTWNQTTGPSNCVAVVSSADGRTLMAEVGTNYGGYYDDIGIYTSIDSGVSWQLSINFPWYSYARPQGAWLSLSANGNELVVMVEYEGYYLTYAAVYVSKDSGANWTETATIPVPLYLVGPHNIPYSVTSLASSSDGTKIVAASLATSDGGGIYASADMGMTWNVISGATTNFTWTSVASSSDGIKLVAAIGSTIYTSTSAGITWNPTVASSGWSPVACSADGMTLVATAPAQGIYTSTDEGATWLIHAPAPTNNFNAHVSVACSADGSVFVALLGDGNIYTLRSVPTPSLTLMPAGTNVLLSWLVPSLSFTVRQSLDLIHWSDVPVSPTLNFTNLHYEIIMPPTSTEARFYCLKH